MLPLRSAGASTRLGSLALAGTLSLIAVMLVVGMRQFSAGTALAIDLGDPQVGASHFFGVERSPEYSFRWSRELSAVSLPALASSQVVSITLNPARPAGEPLPTVRWRVNGRASGEIATRPGWNTYTLNVGASLSPDIRLTLESDTFYPGKGDRRALGVAVARISTAPTANRFGLELPPLLWLLLSPLWTMLAAWVGLLLSLPFRARTGATTLAAFVPAAWAGLVPAAWALPLFAWLVGLGFTVCALASIYRWAKPSSWLVVRLRALGRSRWELPAVGALAGLLSLANTWPTLERLSTSLPGWPGDNFAFLYKLWWFRASIVQEGRWPFFDPGSYAPFGFNLGQGEPTLINTLPGVVTGVLTNDVVSYNLLAFMSFVVSAIGGYLLVREVTSSRLAGLLGGLAFAFAPYRMSQFAGHLQLLGTGWIALAFYFLERLLKTQQGRQGLFLGLALGLAALSAWYYAYMVALALAVYFLLRVISLRGGLNPMRLARGLSAGIVVFLLLASPVAVPSLQLWAQGQLTHSAKAADENSAAPLDYIVPNPLQPVWGEAGMRAHAEQNVIESALYIGVVLTLIAVAGWLVTIRRERRQWKSSWLPWAGLAAVCFVLSLGLTLHDANGQVKLAGGGIVPLPGQLLYNWLPLYSSMRAFARFGLLVMLAATALMGLGWAALLRWGPAWLRARPLFSTSLAALLLLVDFWTGPFAWGTSRVEPGQLETFLAKQPSGIVMQMPLASSQSGPALYRRVFYGKPIAYGYETFEPPQWRSARPTLEAFPSDATFDLLKGWGVRYIVVSGKAYGADWPGTLSYLRTLPRMRYRADFRERGVWDVDPQVLDARPDMEEYALPDTPAVFELVR